ncbi:hypothetical protein EIP91_011527 [Steccherinum ochraceum]|uniref:Uncharacterized protein n=1 Tax=Steccherinum ochraceum TaxID=92696 RepID=A0A4R0RPK2_9APHY|nr:hypothetical protein EIP91_011527 [Steccherinum ochraceum]
MAPFFMTSPPHSPTPVRIAGAKTRKAVVSRLTGRSESSSQSSSRATSPEYPEHFLQEGLLQQLATLHRWQGYEKNHKLSRSNSTSSTSSTWTAETPDLFSDSSRPSTPSTSGFTTPNSSRLCLSVFSDDEEDRKDAISRTFSTGGAHVVFFRLNSTRQTIPFQGIHLARWAESRSNAEHRFQDILPSEQYGHKCSSCVSCSTPSIQSLHPDEGSLIIFSFEARSSYLDTCAASVQFHFGGNTGEDTLQRQCVG